MYVCMYLCVMYYRPLHLKVCRYTRIMMWGDVSRITDHSLAICHHGNGRESTLNSPTTYKPQPTTKTRNEVDSK